MRFGLTLPHYGFSLPGEEPITFEAVADSARRAERLGFDSVWISDHFFYSFGRYGADPAPIAAIEPLTAIAGLATLTERIRLGTLVLGAPFRHPSIVAKMATTIDAIAGGRLDLGIGAGWLEQEFDAFGYPFGSIGERFDTLEETLQVLHGLLSGEATSFDGPTVRLREARALPASEPRIPVWVGGKGGPKVLRLAARYADGWNGAWRWTPESYGQRARAARQACEREGRDPATFRLSVGLYSLLGQDDRAFRARFARAAASMPGDAMREENEETWRADTLSGTPDQAIERVRAFEDLGVEEIVIAPWVLPFSEQEPEIVELFAERVLPAFRADRRDVPVPGPDALGAAVAVLHEAEEPLHWTVIQDRALRAGHLDPFATSNVRKDLLAALRTGVREGVLVTVDRGVYALAPRENR
ncbi:MAG TPA: LLM class flavin-dependent oxidoreductase [Actinomycetota bacterium]|jgi:probable F420-dependent oxidoreductase